MFRFLARFYLGVANGTFKYPEFRKILVRSRWFCVMSRLAGSFSVLDPRIFFRKVSESQDTFVAHLESRKFV